MMKENGLMVSQRRQKAKRVAKRSKPRADRPRQYWGIEMTKFMVPSVGWVYLVIVVDWFTKNTVGWNLSLRSLAPKWKQALEMAIEREFREGVRGNRLCLISDNGSQPTSTSFMGDMATLGIKQVFTSNGNGETQKGDEDHQGGGYMDK